RLIGLARIASRLQAFVCNPQVVGNLGVGSVPRLHWFKVRLCFVEARQTRTQTSCRFAKIEAVGKFRERILIGLERLKKPAVQLLFVSELDPIILSSVRRLGNAIRSLRPNVDVRNWSPVIFSLGLSQ